MKNQANRTNDTRKVKVLLLPETIKKKSYSKNHNPLIIDVSSEGPSLETNSRRRAFARNVDFSFIVSGSERTFTFRVSLNTLPTLATLSNVTLHNVTNVTSSNVSSRYYNRSNVLYVVFYERSGNTSYFDEIIVSITKLKKNVLY